MTLKEIVDQLLREDDRSLSWLAAEMNKTFEGLKLSLVKGSIKYTDLKLMAQKLKVSPARFFEDKIVKQDISESLASEQEISYTNVRNELSSCKEMVNTLKSQIKDKEKIITLLSDAKK